MKTNRKVILENGIKDLKDNLLGVDSIKKVNEKISDLQFEQNKEDCRKIYRIQIELKQAYLAGYHEGINDALGGDKE